MKTKPAGSLILLFCLTPSSQAAESMVPSTYADVSYGPHKRNVLDFWQAMSDQPTPLAVFIHGVGFQGGSKENLPARDLKDLLDRRLNSTDPITLACYLGLNLHFRARGGYCSEQLTTEPRQS